MITDVFAKRIAVILDDLTDEIPIKFDRWLDCSPPDKCQIYGWIHREAPKERDFVLLTFTWKDDDLWVEFTTSSRKYSAKIYETLYGVKEGHNTCLPINVFPAKLKEGN